MFDLQSEYSALAHDLDIDWRALDGAHVLITGATGLIGSLCARTLLERNRMRGGEPGITVHVLVRDAGKVGRSLPGYGAADGLVIHEGSLSDTERLGDRMDYIIHAACPTASKFFMEHPVETFDAICGGTRSLLEYARRCHAKSMTYISSMEVYGKGNGQAGVDAKLSESQVGYVDPCAVRSCYSEGKRAAENLCVGYASEYGVPVNIARLAQTFGPGIPQSDNRLFAQLARSAMSGTDFVMKTTGASTRMYVYTSDAVAAILTILLSGGDGLAYNVANPRTYSSIYEMAQMVFDRFGQGEGRVVVDVDPDAPYPPEHHLPLDTSRLESLGWRPQVDLDEIYRRLIDYLD